MPRVFHWAACICLLPVILAPAAFAASPSSSSGSTLTSLSQIQALTREQASAGHPALIRATVTFYDASRKLLIIQEENCGIYIHDDFPLALKPGDQVEINGRTNIGDFAPVLELNTIRRIKASTLPTPVRPSLDDLAANRFDNVWVELQAKVLAIQGDPPLDTDETPLSIMMLSVGGRRIRTLIEQPPPQDVDRYIGATVRVRGVNGTATNSHSQLLGSLLLVKGFNDVQIDEITSAKALSNAVTPIGGILRYQPGGQVDSRVRLQGVLTLTDPSVGFYLQDQDCGIRLEGDFPSSLKPGDEIEAIGFATASSEGVVVSDVMTKRVHLTTHPGPVQVSADQVIPGHWEARLISVEGTLLNMSRVGGWDHFDLRTGSITFSAQVRTPLSQHGFFRTGKQN